MKTAILGAGNIAKSMAAALRGLQKRGENVEPYAVGARELSRAEAFAREQGLTEEEAGAIASEDAGEVWVESVALDTVAGRKRYDVKCVGDGLEADYQINPESGRIIKKTIQYL